MGIEKVQLAQNYRDEIKTVLKDQNKGKEAVLLDCYTAWCSPCDTMTPVLAKFAEKPEFKKIHFLRLDVDDLPDNGSGLDIRGVPSFLMFELESGEPNVTDEFVGANPRAIEQMLVKAARKISDREKGKSRAAKDAGKNSDSPASPAGRKTEETENKAEPTPPNPGINNAATGVGSAAAQDQNARSASKT